MIKIKGTEILMQAKFSKYCSKKYIANDGSERGWEYFSKKNIIVILAKTSDEKYILINNFRLPIESDILECPAGLLDNSNLPLEQAKKELLEETGYSSDEFMLLGTFKINAGITDNTVTYFFANDVRKVAEKELEVSEQNEVFCLTEQEIFNYMNAGKIIDSNIFSLIYLSKKYDNNRNS